MSGETSRKVFYAFGKHVVVLLYSGTCQKSSNVKATVDNSFFCFLFNFLKLNLIIILTIRTAVSLLLVKHAGPETYLNLLLEIHKTKITFLMTRQKRLRLLASILGGQFMDDGDADVEF